MKEQGTGGTQGSRNAIPYQSDSHSSSACVICDDKERDQYTLMVVSFPKDVIAFENAEYYRGLYHVLNGVISLSKGNGVDDLNITSLLKRLDEHHFKEVIIATNPTIEGETTALYIAKLIEDKVDVVKAKSMLSLD